MSDAVRLMTLHANIIKSSFLSLVLAVHIGIQCSLNRNTAFMKFFDIVTILQFYDIIDLFATNCDFNKLAIKSFLLANI